MRASPPSPPRTLSWLTRRSSPPPLSLTTSPWLMPLPAPLSFQRLHLHAFPYLDPPPSTSHYALNPALQSERLGGRT